MFAPIQITSTTTAAFEQRKHERDELMPGRTMSTMRSGETQPRPCMGDRSRVQLQEYHVYTPCGPNRSPSAQRWPSDAARTQPKSLAAVRC
jgi:hypothetical protein